MATTIVTRPKKHQKTFGAKIGQSNVISYIVLSLGSILMLAPFYWMVIASFMPAYKINSYPLVWWPSQFTLEHYTQVFIKGAGGIGILIPIGNSLYIAAFTTVGCVFTSTLLGYIFAKFRFVGRETVFSILLATMMIPFAMTMIPTHMLVRDLG